MTDILHVITSLDVGGAEVLLADLVTRSNGTFRHRVISLLPGGDVRPRLERAGIPVTDLGMRHGRPSLRALLALRRAVGAARPDVVHAWMYHACFAAALARPRGSRLLWGLHSANMDLALHPITTSLVVTTACRMLSRMPDTIVVNSSETRDYHSELGYKPKQWALIANGIDAEEFRPDPARRAQTRAALGVPNDVPLIGFIARRDPQKDHVTFLRAAERLTQQMPAVQFVLAGLFTDDRLMDDLVRRHAPTTRLHRLGVRTDIAAVTAALDVATVCSFGESFSNSLAEAMSCGVPCVVSDVPPLPEILAGTGSVVKGADPDALAGAWRSILNETPARRQDRGNRARQRILTDFSAANMVSRFEALYHAIQRNHRHP